MPATKVFAEADIKVFKENDLGVLISTDPILTYCYAEGIAITSSKVLQRRAVPGRGHRRIIRRAAQYDDWVIVARHIWTKRTEEHNTQDIFQTKKHRLQLWFDFNDVSLTAEEKEIWKFSGVKVSDFGLSGAGAESMEGSATFWAEQLLE
jgi:hypothetical protein